MAKKNTSRKTSKTSKTTKSVAKPAASRKKTVRECLNESEVLRFHMRIITVLSIVVAILVAALVVALFVL